jgi:basic amino acid/polyamine antiporter, APA family
MLLPWQELTNLPKDQFATAYAFQQAFGSHWPVRLLMFGAILSLLKVFNGMFLSSTRLLYALGRRNLLGGGLGDVNHRFQTPHMAILLVGTLTLLGSLLGRSVLVPISEVGTLAGALGWLAASLACAAGAAGKSPGVRLLGVSGALVSAALAFVAVQESFTAVHWLTVGLWGLLGKVLWLKRPGQPTASPM